MAQQDPEEKAQELIAQMDRMLDEAESMVRRTDDLYGELGLERDTSRKFLESGKVPQGEREKIQKELAALQEELDRDAREVMESVEGRQELEGALQVEMGNIRV